MFVVCVTFTTHPKHHTRFMELVAAQADASVTLEEGCYNFDVCSGEAGHVFLYERYENEPAFEAHLESAHFRKFNQNTRELIQEKSLKTFELAHRGGASS